MPTSTPRDSKKQKRRSRGSHDQFASSVLNIAQVHGLTYITRKFLMCKLSFTWLRPTVKIQVPTNRLIFLDRLPFPLPVNQFLRSSVWT